MPTLALSRSLWTSDGTAPEAGQPVSWRVRDERLCLDFAVRFFPYQLQDELWAWLIFDCCGASMRDWENCRNHEEHPVRHDTAMYPVSTLSPGDGVVGVEAALPLWVAYGRPDLDPLTVQVLATSLDLYLRETDWTGRAAAEEWSVHG